MLSADMLYLYANEVSTGSATTDHLNTVRLAMEPEYWALLDYLSDKGILDEQEFASYLGRHLNAQVASFNRTADPKIDE